MVSADLIELLSLLVDQQRDLAQHIKSEAHSIWMPGINSAEDETYGELYSVNSHPEYLMQAISSINCIEYKDGQHGRETQKQKGIILTGPASLKAANAINETKSALSDQFAMLRKSLSKNHSLKDLVHQQEAIRRILSRAGISRLCINQAKRSLPVISKPPHRVSWLEKRAKSIKKISVYDAEAMLKKLTSEQAGIDLHKLGELRAEHLAIVQTPKTPTIKATVYHPEFKDGVKIMVNNQIHAPVPILCATGNEAPRILKGGNRKNTPRSDKQISDDVFLPSIRAHLYLAAGAA